MIRLAFLSQLAKLRRQTARFAVVYARFMPLLAPHRNRILLAVGAMLGVLVTGLVAPWPLQIVIDGVLLGHTDRGVIALFGDWAGAHPSALLLAACLSVVVIAALRGLFLYVQTIESARVGHRAIAQLRVQLFSKLQQLTLRFHARRRQGDLVVRMTGDVSMLRDVLLPSMLDLMSRLLLVAGMLTLMALMDGPLTLVSISLLPLLAFASFKYGGRIRDATRRQRRKEGHIASVTGEALASLPMVQAFSSEDDLVDRFSKQNRRSLRAGLRALKLQESLNRIVEISLAGGTSLVLGLGALRAMNGGMSPGELVVFLAYLRGMYRPIQGVVRIVSKFNKAAACGERVLEVLESHEMVQDAPDAIPAPAFRGEIVFDRVTFGYDPARPILRDVSFRVAPGEKVGLVGPSGSGKSTILALLLRFYEPQQGRILIDGVDIRRYTLESVRRQISILLQEPFLFGMSAFENILFGDPDATRSEVVAAAKAAGAHEFLEALPEGYDTVLGERGHSLSRGQQQRIALARALVRKAPILVFDEPTTGLDGPTEREIVRTLSKVAQRRGSCLWIAHDLTQIQDCDRVIVLHDGVVAESGAPEHLLGAGGAFSRLFREVG